MINSKNINNKKTIKNRYSDRLGQRMVVWLQAEVRLCGLGLRPRLNQSWTWVHFCWPNPIQSKIAGI